MESHAESYYPVVQSILEIEKNYEVTRYIPANKNQEEFLKILRMVEYDPSIEEIKSKSSHQASVVNAFLKKQNSSLRVEEMPEEEFYTAAFFDLNCQWTQKASPDNIGKYKAGKHLKAIYHRVNNSSVVIEFPVKIAGTRVFAKLINNPPSKKIGNLINMVHDFTPTVKSSETIESIIPLFDLKIEGGLEWIESLGVNSKFHVYRFGEFKQHLNISADLVGTRVKQSVAGMLLKCKPKVFRFNRPFLFWITRKDLSLPMVAAYVAKDCWIS